MAQKKTAAKKTTKKANVKSTGKKRTNTKNGGRKTTSSKNTKKNTRKTTPNAYDDSGVFDEVISLIIIAVSIVAIISLFTDKIGIVGDFIGSLLKGTFGLGGFFLPFIVIVLCVWSLFSEERYGIKFKIGASALFVVCMASFAHAITLGDQVVKAANLFANGSAGNGGLVGGIIGGTMVKYFDKLGTYIILAVLIIVSVVMGTGLSFFDGVESAARYVGDSGKRREERVKVRAEKLKVKETEREIKQAERAERVKKRKEVFNILMDKDGFDAGEKGGFAGGNDSIVIGGEKEEELYPDGQMPSDYLVRNIARHTGTAKPEMDIKNDDNGAVIQFNKDRGIQCVISNGDFDEDSAEDENEIEFEINGIPEDAVLEEVSEDEIERECLETENEIITKGASKEGYMPHKLGENSIDSGIIGGDIYTPDEMKTVMGLDGDKAEPEKHVKTDYKFPPISILGKDPKAGTTQSKAQMLATAQKLEDTLKSFGVDAKVMQINQGPTVTRYEVSPSHGVKVSKIVNLADDIALNLAASGIRIEAPIP